MSLFGITNSNRNFNKADSWGKNQFNSAFPAALCNYMFSKGLTGNYITFEKDKTLVKEIDIKNAYGISPMDENIFFSFEDRFIPYEKLCKNLPRVDLVIKDTKENYYSGLEIKLTVIPDNSTHSLREDEYSPELVVRPDTIVYLACSLAHSLGEHLANYFLENPIINVNNWSSIN